MVRKSILKLAARMNPIEPKDGFPIEKRIGTRVWRCWIEPGESLTFAEVAAALGITVQAVHQLYQRKKFRLARPLKGGASFKVPYAEVTRLMTERGIDLAATRARLPRGGRREKP